MQKYSFLESVNFLSESGRERRILRDIKRGKISPDRYERMLNQDPRLETRIASKMTGRAGAIANSQTRKSKKSNGGLYSTNSDSNFKTAKAVGRAIKHASGSTRGEIATNAKNDAMLARRKLMANDVINTVDA